MSHEFIKIFRDGKFNMPVVMPLKPNTKAGRNKVVSPGKLSPEKIAINFGGKKRDKDSQGPI